MIRWLLEDLGFDEPLTDRQAIETALAVFVLAVVGWVVVVLILALL